MSIYLLENKDMELHSNSKYRNLRFGSLYFLNFAFIKKRVLVNNIQFRIKIIDFQEQKNIDD